ncbi:MAG: Redox-sensing transcriptional repressor Rex [Phycisphaerales bacterium]|nr:Redox-sensing transcriptional repressor Rex [Phycisphaerales bacterium]
MNIAPIKRTLSVTGLLLAGAAGGVVGTKFLAPQWLAPTSANASLSINTTGPVSVTTSAPAAPDAANKSIFFTVPTTRPITTAKPPVATGPVALTPEDENARRRSLLSQLMSCRSQLEQYKLQHHDKLPDFSKHLWNQLTSATRGDGTPDAKGSCGPYLQTVPTNPLNGFASLGLVRKDPAPGQLMPGDKLGFVFCPATGHLFGTGPDGKTIFDEATATEAPIAGTREIKVAAIKTQLQTLRADLELYKLQHVDLPPDFAHNPGWEQMTRKTRSTGAFDLRGFGPYVTRRPINAINGFYKVETAATVPVNYKAKGQQIGYVFETSTSRLFATDEEGSLLKE